MSDPTPPPDLAYGELKLREASSIMPPDDVASPAQLTAMSPELYEKTMPSITTPLKIGDGEDGEGLDKVDEGGGGGGGASDWAGAHPHTLHAHQLS